MKLIELKESELRSITLFLIDKKVIFHPKISPNGVPDFTGYHGKKFCLILDRNLVVKILRLASQGELKDKFDLKLVSSLLLWAEFNNIAITAGLAQMEYSHHHGNDIEASKENNVFLKIFDQYDPTHWLDLALGRRLTIPPVNLEGNIDYKFFMENDHYKMHYLEMLKLSQLYYNDSISVEHKFENLHQWVFENILICKYTTFFAVLAFGGKSKMFRNLEQNFKIVDKKCQNQAWDLTYLSLWSTKYYYENDSNEVFLFATHDEEMKDLLTLTHQESLEIYQKVFGKVLGDRISDFIGKIYVPREKPKVELLDLDKMIVKEKDNLRHILQKYYAI
jgi:hypothetical protein